MATELEEKERDQGTLDAQNEQAIKDILEGKGTEPTAEELKAEKDAADKAEADKAKAEKDAAEKAEADKAKVDKLKNSKTGKGKKEDDKPEIETEKKLTIGKQGKVEEPKVDDKPPESKILEDPAPENLSKKGAEDWTTMKEKANTAITGLETDVKDREKIITGLRERMEKGQDGEAMEKLKGENVELNKRLEQVDLGNSPAFKEKYGDPITSMTDALKEKLKEYEIPNNVDKLLAKTGKALAMEIEEIINGAEEGKGLPRYEQQDIIDTIREIQKLTSESSDAMSNAAKANEMLKGKFSSQVEESFNTHFKAITTEEGRMLDRIEPSDDATEDQKQYAFDRNASLDNMEAVARKIATGDVNQDDINQYAVLAAWAMDLHEWGLPAIQEKFNHMVDKVNSYAVEMEKILEMNPDVRADVEKALKKGPDGPDSDDPDREIENIMREHQSVK